MNLEFFLRQQIFSNRVNWLGNNQDKMIKICMKIEKSAFFRNPQFPFLYTRENSEQGSYFEIGSVLKNWRDQSQIFSEMHFAVKHRTIFSQLANLTANNQSCQVKEEVNILFLILYPLIITPTKYLFPKLKLLSLFLVF